METKILDECEREQIHLCGAIQPHGLLIGFRADYTISHVSNNSMKILGKATKSILNSKITSLLTEESLVELRRNLNPKNLVLRNVFPVKIFNFLNEQIAMEAVLHSSGVDLFIMELCPNSNASSRIEELVQFQPQSVTDVSSYLHLIAHHFKRLVGYERVMVYRFMTDGSGVVVAEANDRALGSFLNHHFPASDIPKQARELYIRNRVREIRNVNYSSVDIQAARGESTIGTLDLSDSFLRSVSPVHIEYLKNMRVSASMSASLVIDGQLWGLVACHSSSPTATSFEVLNLCKFVANMYSATIAQMLKAEKESRLRELTTGLLQWSISTELEPLFAYLIEQFHSQATVIFTKTRLLASKGLTPRMEKASSLLQHKLYQEPNKIYSSTALIHEIPDWNEKEVAGCLGYYDARLDLGLLLLREETLLSLFWAGDPNKLASSTFTEGRVEPRKSFESWKQQVSGTSRAWTDEQIETMKLLVPILLKAYEKGDLDVSSGLS